MKRAALFLSLLLSLSVASAEQITTGVRKTWTVDSAREAAFAQAKQTVDLSGILPVDPHLLENRIAINQGAKTVDRRMIALFSGGMYMVAELCSNTALYYSLDGQLSVVEYVSSPYYSNGTCKGQFPASSYKHAFPSGRLGAVGLHVSGQEAFSFYPDGTLTSHWINERCYNPDGSSCGTRRSFETK